MSKLPGHNWSSESAAAAVGRFNIRKIYNTVKGVTKGRKRPLKICPVAGCFKVMKRKN